MTTSGFGSLTSTMSTPLDVRTRSNSAATRIDRRRKTPRPQCHDHRRIRRLARQVPGPARFRFGNLGRTVRIVPGEISQNDEPDSAGSSIAVDFSASDSAERLAGSSWAAIAAGARHRARFSQRIVVAALRLALSRQFLAAGSFEYALHMYSLFAGLKSADILDSLIVDCGSPVDCSQGISAPAVRNSRPADPPSGMPARW